MADSKDIGKDLEQSLKDSKKLQGDQNLELNKTINLLSKINDLREESISKVKSLNRQSINLKEIEKEVQKAKQKELLATEKLKKIEEQLSTSAKTSAKEYITRIEQRRDLENELAKATKINNAGQMAFLRNQLSMVDAELIVKENTLGVDERKYAALLQSNKIAKDNVEVIEEELLKEKELNKNIGFTGKAMGFFAEKLGVGKEYYADMVEKARDLNEEGKKLTFFDKLGGLGKAAKGAASEAFADPLTLIPMIGGAVAGVAKGVKSVFDYIVGIQDNTVKFAKAMNLSTAEARNLKMQFASINVSNGNLFVNTQNLVESQTEMVDLLGTTNVLSSEILSTNVMLKDVAGLEAETRKGIVESSVITGKSAESTVKAVLRQNAALKLNTGIQFQNQKILKEASSLGGYLGLQFAKYPENLTKALLKTKSLGLELKQLDSMADSFLDFESSISKEFEAQLLTGKEINLAKAREAFLNNDLATAAEEITRQVGSAADFSKMNRIQQESIAGAMGMSRDQMSEMLKQQEMLSNLGAKDLKDAQAKVQALKAQGKTREEIVAMVTEEGYQNLMNASLQDKISGFINKIKQSLADFVENTGIIGKIESFVEKISNPETIKGIIGTIRDAISNFIAFTGELLADVSRFIARLPFTDRQKWMDRGDIIQETTARVAARIGAMGGDLSFAAAKEKAGSGNASSATQQSTTKMGASTQPIVIEGKLYVDGRPTGVLLNDSIKKGAQVDGVQSTKAQ